MQASLIKIIAIMLLSTVAGAVWAQYQGFSWAVDAAAVQARRDLAERADEIVQQGQEEGSELNIDLDRLRDLIEQQATIIDARNADQFAEGHLQVYYDPPVLNVPPDEFDMHLDRLMPLQGNTFVLYCNSETCHLAEELYVRLQEMGFDIAPIYIYKPGWEGLQASDLPQGEGPDEWTGFGSVPIDPGPYGEEAAP